MRVLVCAPIIPEHDRESGSRRLMDLIGMLVDNGASVTFVGRDATHDSRYLRSLRQLGVATWRGNDPAVADVLTAGDFDLALLMFWYVAETYMPQLRAHSPRTRIVVDTVDLHFLRVARERFFRAGEAPPLEVLDNDFASELARELNVYAAADAVLTVSEKEAGLIDDLVARPGHARAVPDAESLDLTPASFADRRGVLFVGNFRHPPNRDAAVWLCHEIVPRIDPTLLERHPVSIVGTDPTNDVIEAAEATPGVQLVGWVPSLQPWLEQSRASIVPLQWGAGTKRKLLQALMAGVPCASTSIGAEGLGLVDGEHVLIGDDAGSLAAATTELLTDWRAWTRLRNNAREHVAPRNSMEEAARRLAAVCTDVLARPPRRMTQAGEDSGAGDSLASLRRWPEHRYRRMLGEIRHAVSASVPDGAGVMVLSRGDPRLVDYVDRPAWHAPCTDDGVFAGWYPADSAGAIDVVRTGQRLGASHLVIPATSAWWLDHYADFGAWLLDEGVTVWQDEWCRVVAVPDAVEPAVGRRAG